MQHRGGADMIDAVRTSDATMVTQLVALETPQKGTFEAIHTALDAFSQPQLGPSTARLLVIPIGDESGAVRGGLWGHTSFGWLHVQMLYVPDALRGQGIGTRLMAAAEAEAKRRGCRGVHLCAYDFQAAAFYRRLGYTQFGQLDDYPCGYDLIMLKKVFRGDVGGDVGQVGCAPACCA